jgi:hypothetical protein
MNGLTKGITRFNDKQMSDAPYDKTVTARVLSVEIEGYNILLNDVEYTNVPTLGGTCSINETVQVTIPQNNYSNMFIIKTPTSSGESLVTSVNGRNGDVVLSKSDVGLSNVDNTSDANKNVLSATKLTNARAISLGGDVSGSVSFNGSSDVSIVSTVADNSHNHIVSNISDLTATANELNVLDGITATTTELNYTDGVTSNIQTQFGNKADLSSPTFTGTPSAPTAINGTSTTQLATTAFVNAEIASDATPISHVGSTGSSHGVATTSVNGFMSTSQVTKLNGIETGAEVNNISDTNATDLTDGGDSSLHYHSSDRNRANHSGTQLASTISNFASAVLATVLTGLSTATNSAILATDTILVALGKLQSQINNLFAVKYTTQTLTDAQKLQARTNIGAGTSAVTKTSELINDNFTVIDGNYVHTDNNFTDTYMTKLDNVGEASVYQYSGTVIHNQIISLTVPAIVSNKASNLSVLVLRNTYYEQAFYGIDYVYKILDSTHIQITFYIAGTYIANYGFFGIGTWTPLEWEGE